MSRIKALLAAFALYLCTAPVLQAAELLMFEEDGCSWCQRWHAEIGSIYPKTVEGKRAPLRLINLHRDGVPGSLQLESRPHFTPTFVLIEEGREVGRIEGYPGEDFFWGLLAVLIAQLDGEGEGAS